MFWIFAAAMGLILFAIKLGQISVWFLLLKIALVVALLVIAAMGVALLYNKTKS